MDLLLGELDPALADRRLQSQPAGGGGSGGCCGSTTQGRATGNVLIVLEMLLSRPWIRSRISVICSKSSGMVSDPFPDSISLKILSRSTRRSRFEGMVSSTEWLASSSCRILSPTGIVPRDLVFGNHPDDRLRPSPDRKQLREHTSALGRSARFPSHTQGRAPQGGPAAGRAGVHPPARLRNPRGGQRSDRGLHRALQQRLASPAARVSDPGPRPREAQP